MPAVMSLADVFQAEFDHEACTTRSLLSRIPDGMADWAPHAKSKTLGQLAMHVAELPAWASNILTQPAFDVAPVGGQQYVTPDYTSHEEALQVFEAGTKAMLNALDQMTEEKFAETWRLLSGGRQIVAMPRSVALRTWVFNHLIHHRAQLGVYLRMLDLPLPGTYGPSADDLAGMV